MSRTCLMVVNGARARFFVLDAASGPEGEEVAIEERGDLINPAVEIDPFDRSDDHGTGRRRMFRGGPTHGYEDRWDRSAAHLKDRFAGLVANEGLRIATEAGAYRVVIVADPHMLGLLRHHQALFANAHIRCSEHAGDFTRLNAAALHRRVVDLGLVPAPVALGATG